MIRNIIWVFLRRVNKMFRKKQREIKVRMPTQKGDEAVVMSEQELKEKQKDGWLVVDNQNGELVEKVNDVEDVTIFPPVSGG